MHTQNSYQLYKVRQDEELRNAQQRHLAQQAQAVQQPGSPVYRVALAQVGRTLVALGQRLQNDPEPQPMPREA